MIATLADDTFEPGDYELGWDEDGRPGRYFVKLTSGEIEQRELLLDK